MAGSSFGRLLSLTSFGESHGPAIGGVLDGCPPGLALSAEQIQLELDRRRPGQNRYVTQRQEPDRVEILSGVFEGLTTGTPIGFVIRNQDAKSRDYNNLAEVFRPGHADLTYHAKYGHRDHRGGGRASARETAVRVAAGAVAKLWLKHHFGTQVRAYVAQIGAMVLGFESWERVATSPFMAATDVHDQQLGAYLDELRSQKDSVGALVKVVAEPVPAGWGSPVYDRLDALIAYALMSINAAKAVDIGTGREAVAMTGSQHNDPIRAEGFLSNHAGGILGGISSGQAIVASVAFKPTASLARSQMSIDQHGKELDISTLGRHDPCVGIRAVPVVEAMLALVLMDQALCQAALRQHG